MTETTIMSKEPVQGESNVQEIMDRAFDAFHAYKQISKDQRAVFLEEIAAEIEKRRPALVAVAGSETNLPEARLNGEISRTTGQLRMFANLIREGSWVEAAIDTTDTGIPAKPDVRKMLLPVGPVVVFGASNFPFAFSTAGGDTASALASGSSVVVRGHFAHMETSLLVFEAIQKAIKTADVPRYTVQHVADKGNGVGRALVMHKRTKGVGFTGSFKGGSALMDYAAQRDEPIPVFAEMSSVNPVVFYPNALEENAVALAGTYASSINLGVGQFCTNPGMLIGLKSPAFDAFLDALGNEICKVTPGKMLHSGISQAYNNSLGKLIENEAVSVVGQSKEIAGDHVKTVVAAVSAKNFLSHPQLAEEIFGPYSIAVICDDKEELKRVLKSLKGQLTTTLMATEKDIKEHADVIALQHTLAGRIILNNVPTGVEVCASMIHGGPYPATSDARFTSVGSSAIKRWVRPVAFQNFSDYMLPPELKNSNPAGIMRLVDNVYTRDNLPFKK